MLTEQLQAGQQFEHFRIEAFVLRTSMTTIYRATDLRTNQLVALKIPHPELECDPVFFSRFQREMFIGKKLDHPGVVRMFDSSDMNQPCIVMEWVEDGFLRQILTDGRENFCRTCDAHRRGSLRCVGIHSRPGHCASRS